MSPYVRKAAACSIPKCYTLDPSLIEPLTEMIEYLFDDKSLLVIGSVVSSFNQICPEKSDMIHKRYRKFCRVIGDIDEWGQLEIMNVLMRYVRLNFSFSEKVFYFPFFQYFFRFPNWIKIISSSSNPFPTYSQVETTL